MSTNTSSSSCNKHNLLIPIIFICRPIVKCTSTEVVVYDSGQPEVEQGLQSAKSLFVKDGKI